MRLAQSTLWNHCIGRAAASETKAPRRKIPRLGGPPSAALCELRLPFGVTYTNVVEEANELAKELVAAHAEGALDRLGFDIEWVVTFVEGEAPRKTATLQLASTRGCLVFQLSAMQHFPELLERLLCDRSLIKVGCGISNDGLKLRNTREILPYSVLYVLYYIVY